MIAAETKEKEIKFTISIRMNGGKQAKYSYVKDWTYMCEIWSFKITNFQKVLAFKVLSS